MVACAFDASLGPGVKTRHLGLGCWDAPEECRAILCGCPLAPLVQSAPCAAPYSEGVQGTDCAVPRHEQACAAAIARLLGACVPRARHSRRRPEVEAGRRRCGGAASLNGGR
eukprot:13097595-Alexandrium_andersonii.AAC.1